MPHRRLLLLDARFRRRQHARDQIVGFHAQAFAAADFHVRFRFFGGNFIAHFGGAAGCQRNNLVIEVNRVFGFLRVAESADAFRDHVLQISLARVNHVVDDVDAAKMRRSWLDLVHWWLPRPSCRPAD